MSCRGGLLIKPLGSFFVASALSVCLVCDGRGTEPIPSDVSKGSMSDLMVRGDVLLIEGEYYFVKDTTGHEVRLHVNSETKSEDRIKVGDKIEARITSEGHARSITLQIPQDYIAPPLPNSSPGFHSEFPERGVAH